MGHSHLKRPYGLEQIGFTSSPHISLIAVLIPFSLWEISLGVSSASSQSRSRSLFLSPPLSLTLRRMMASKLLKHTPDSEKSSSTRSLRTSSTGSSKVRCGVRFVLRHQTSTLIVTVATFVGTLSFTWLFRRASFCADTGAILAYHDAPQDISFDAMSQRTGIALQILKDPDVESLSSSSVSTLRIPIQLRAYPDQPQRRESRKDDHRIMRRLQPKLNQVEAFRPTCRHRRILRLRTASAVPVPSLCRRCFA